MNTQDGRSMSREVLESYRLRAIHLRYELGYSVDEIAEIFGLNYYSVSRWFTRYRRGGEDALKRTLAKGADRRLSPEILTWLEDALLKPATEWGFETPLWTGPMVRGLLRRECSIEIHRATVWRYLRELGLTYQKPERRYIEQNVELVKQWINEEWPKITEWVRNNRAILYFEDESGISIAPVIGKGWGRKGRPPIIRVTGKRGGILAMSAVSLSGTLRFRLEKRRVNSDVMIEFLQQILDSHKRRKIAVVMDQAPCHTSRKVRDFTSKQKRLEVFYIPPYSPELNPDEKVWKHLKHASLKNHQAQCKTELSRLVLGALRCMQKSPDLLLSFFDNYLA